MAAAVAVAVFRHEEIVPDEQRRDHRTGRDLERFDQEGADQEHDHDGKRQGTVTGKVCFGAPVPGNEGRIVDEIT